MRMKAMYRGYVMDIQKMGDGLAALDVHMVFRFTGGYWWNWLQCFKALSEKREVRTKPSVI